MNLPDFKAAVQTLMASNNFNFAIDFNKIKRDFKRSFYSDILT